MTRTLTLPLLDPAEPTWFPDPSQALTSPDGLLAFGGDLSPARLLAAYARGIFPWFNADEPILWWSPDPRCVFDVERLRPGRSLRRQLGRRPWTFTLDHAFDAVVEACAAPRDQQTGTWIIPAMAAAYGRLHRLGHAHSVEAWEDGRLVGGLYGVAIGRLFCGESMFSRESGGSKLALMALARQLRSWNFPLIDAQVTNPHLLSLGAREIDRRPFLDEVARLVIQPGRPGSWRSELPPPD